MRLGLVLGRDDVVNKRGFIPHLIRHASACLVLAIGLTASAMADDRAECRDRAGAPDAAIAACTRLIAAGTTRGSELADIHAARGTALRMQGDFDRAIADFDAAILIAPSRAIFLEHRGTAWFAKRDYDRAIADYDRAVQINPKLVPAYAGRARVNFAKGALDAALADFQLAIGINPRAAVLYLQRGNVWRRKGDPARAIADYSEALR